jgi:hypothetical protein
VARAGEDGLEVELHALDREFPMPPPFAAFATVTATER